MKTLKRLGAAIALTFVFAFAAFADCEPGVVNTPCLGAQTTPDDPLAPAEPSESVTSNSAGVEISTTTFDVLLGMLSIF